MPIYRYDIEQRSEQWDQARLGIPTASNFKRLLTAKTGKLSAQSDGYLDELLAEWIFGQPLEDPESQFRSEWMERGNFLEGQARQAYTFETDNPVVTCGIILRDDLLAGASPDGLIGEDGILELKCPSPKIHVSYMRKQTIEGDYFSQLQGLLYISGRKWVDICSYCPPFPSVVIRVTRDEEYINLLAKALDEFIGKLEAAKREIQARYPESVHREAIA